MVKIGITGGIGSGKTTVCKVFELLDIPVFNADQAAKEVMTTDKELSSEIRAFFGKGSYLADGSLDRKYLADIVFNDSEKLNRLNGLVHPAVFRAFDAWIKKVPATVPYVLKEAALLFESGSYTLCDYTILVVSAEKERISRVMQRDSVTMEQVMQRMGNQWSDHEKRELADFTLKNTPDHSIIEQVMAFHAQFTNQ